MKSHNADTFNSFQKKFPVLSMAMGINDFGRMLSKITVEAALNAELEEHLGYSRYEKHDSTNSRNGYTSKTLKTEDGEFELLTPRDRNGTFEPQLVKKHQTRLTSMDDKILSFYAKGMTTREIVSLFKEMYDADVSSTLISKVTDAVTERVIEWQSRPLEAIYLIVYLVSKNWKRKITVLKRGMQKSA
ncbi:MAG: hypothetical protein LEGION0403_FIIPPAGN_00308 [Legionella sp.]